MRIDKRKWEVRPIRVWQDLGDGEFLRYAQGKAEDNGTQMPSVAYVFQNFRRVDEKRGDMLEVYGCGMTLSEAIKKMRAKVRMELSSGRYSYFEDYQP